MNCTACGAPVVPSQRFCMSCGRAIEQLPPPVLSPLGSAPSLHQPPSPPSAPVSPSVAAPPSPPSAPVSMLPPPAYSPPAPVAPASSPESTWAVVEQTPVRPADDSPWMRDLADRTAIEQTSLATSRQAAVMPTAAQPVTSVRRFRVTPLLIVAVLTSGTALASLAATLYSIDIDGVQSTAPRVGELFSNNTIAVLVVALTLVGSAIAASFGSRLFAGVVGGAGLALVGFVAMQISVITEQFDSAGYDRIANGGSITVTLTRDVGFWLLIAAAVGGLVSLGLSLRQAGEDHRPRLDASVAVLGACAAATLALGALIPENGVAFVRNFNDDFVPPATLYLRLGSMALLLLTGILGFLIQRRWGIGLVLGGLVVAVWQWITTLTVDASVATGDVRLGVSGGNLGSADGQPHVVTTVGLAATIALVALSLVLASRMQNRSARS